MPGHVVFLKDCTFAWGIWTQRPYTLQLAEAYLHVKFHLDPSNRLAAFCPSKLPIPMEKSGPYVIHDFWTYPCLQHKRHLDRFSCFTQMTAECPYTLQWATLPPQDCPSRLIQLNTWFLDSNRVLNPNGTSIGSAVFAGLTTVTDRPTEATLLGR